MGDIRSLAARAGGRSNRPIGKEDRCGEDSVVEKHGFELSGAQSSNGFAGISFRVVFRFQVFGDDRFTEEGARVEPCLGQHRRHPTE